MKIIGVKIQNFKSFSSGSKIFDGLSNVNIFIGKNNAGKSSILSAIHTVFEPSYKFKYDISKLHFNLENDKPQVVILRCLFSEEEIKTLFERDVSLDNISFDTIRRSLIQKKLPIDVIFDLNKDYKSKSLELIIDLTDIEAVTGVHRIVDIRSFQNFINSHIQKRKLLNIIDSFEIVHIENPRNIDKIGIANTEYDTVSFIPTGIGLTVVIRNYLNSSRLNDTEIKEILRKDIIRLFKGNEFKIDISVKRLENEMAIHFVEPGKPELPIMMYGRGITDLIAIISCFTLLRKGKSNKKLLYLLEEPENDLEPRLQRNLLNYVKEKSIEYDEQIFITTHSPVFIDSVETSSTYLVKNDKVTEGSKVIKFDDSMVSELTAEIGFKLSYLLHSNLVIYCEGPEDFIALNNFLKKLQVDLKELGISILWLGGDTIKHIVNKLDELFKVNHNLVFFLDSDKEKEEDVVQGWKAELSKALDEKNRKCIFTNGRDIANCFSNNALSKFYNKDIDLGRFEKIKEKLKNLGIAQGYSKISHPKKIIDLMTPEEVEKNKELIELVNEINRLLPKE